MAEALRRRHSAACRSGSLGACSEASACWLVCVGFVRIVFVRIVFVRIGFVRIGSGVSIG